MILGSQQRPAECTTDLTLDAWLAGELNAEALARVQAHDASCGRCQARRAELSLERASFLERHPDPVLRPRSEPRSSARSRGRFDGSSRGPLRWVLATSALGMAAALVLVLLPRKPDPATATVRLKGSAHIGFFVQRGERSQRAAPLYVVHPGDRIRFEYSSEEPAYLAILALDGAQTASVYFPEGPTAEQVPAGTDMLLRSAVELDAVLGDETVYALFCDAPFALAPLRAQLAAAKLLSPAPHCRMDTLTWRKESDR